jgi:glycerol-3-phosphate dehydrogenase
VNGGVVQGAAVTDRISGRELELRSQAVVVAAGPWTRELTERITPEKRGPATHRRALAVNLVIGRRLADVAVGVQARTGLAEDPVCGGHRFLFVVPQGPTTLLGTWYAVDEGSETRALCERGVRSLLREFNEACPGVRLLPVDVVRSQWGWLPLKGGLEAGRATALAERPRIMDHASTDGIRRLLSVEGVKYTTARRVAERVVDGVFNNLGRISPPCRTADLRLDEPGSETYLEPNGAVARADIIHAIREEMALKLSDIVFRRSHLGTLPMVSRITLEQMSHVAGAELGWNASRQEAEVEDVIRQFGIVSSAVEAVR